MTKFSRNDPVVRAIGRRLAEPFVLLDVGCSGGIHPAWRAFDANLRAYAFDPDITEIDRLRDKETNASVTYEAAFVGVPAEHGLSDQMRRADFLRGSPWERLSIAQTLSARARDTGRAPDPTAAHWSQSDLAADSVYLPDYLKAKQIDDVDFVKIDVDGADLVVLQTLFESPVHERVLGMLLEVNFFGTAEPGTHTFHNTDRLMRQMGFDLFDLSVRRYSSSALPWPYLVNAPGPTLNGRPLQGDALYVRDLTAPAMRETAAQLSDDKLAKAAAIFSLSGHFDQAAEVLSAFSGHLSARFNAAELLELLTRRMLPSASASLSRAEYLDAFAADSEIFYPNPPRRGLKTLVKRLIG